MAVKVIRGMCMTCRTQVRRHALKVALISELGGECFRCGFVGHYAVFDFHHVEGKRITISDAIANCNASVLREELPKCRLICSNCHRTEHCRKDEAFVKALSFYEFRQPVTERQCVDCDKNVSAEAERCRKCAATNQGSIVWPTDKALLKMVKAGNVNRVAKHLGVAYNSVKKRLRKIQRS